MNTYRGSLLLSAVLGSAFVLALAPNAFAGEDIYQGGLKGGYDVPPPVPTDRGIYFKGYIGQANNNVGGIFTEPMLTSPFTVISHEMKSSPLYGLGIGYKRNHWLRLDLTGDYRGDAAFFGLDSAPNANIGPPPIQTNEYTADVRSWLFLANAYWDICNIHGFTPYVGAGIGFASLTVDGLKDVNIPATSVFFADSHTNTNFAWAIHAGLAFDVTDRFAIDLAYRYADLGTAKSGIATAYDGSSSYSGVSIQDITTNDLIVGFRYKLQREQPVMYAVK